ILAFSTIQASLASDDRTRQTAAFAARALERSAPKRTMAESHRAPTQPIRFRAGGDRWFSEHPLLEDLFPIAKARCEAFSSVGPLNGPRSTPPQCRRPTCQ